MGLKSVSVRSTSHQWLGLQGDQWVRSSAVAIARVSGYLSTKIMATSSRTSSARQRPAPDARTAAALKLYVVLMRASAAVTRRVDESVTRHGLSPAEFGILEVLYHRGPMLLGEVQRKILVSSGGITFLVDKLASKGLVERRECETDRRARYAALTTEGERLIERLFPPHAAKIAEVIGAAALTTSEQRELTSLLRRLGTSADVDAVESED